jgi:thiol-disulfide isomerase/thioredoxin
MSSPAKKSFPVIPAVLAALVLLGAIAVAVALSNEENTASADQFGTVQVLGDPLPKFDGAAATDPAVGTVAPDLEGASFAGEATRVGGTGRPSLVLYLAHWCPHCNAEVPRLKAYLDAEGVPDDVDIVLVPTGSNELQPNWPPSEWLEQSGIGDLTTIVDDEDGTAAAAMGLAGYPFMVLLDDDGTVIERRSGEQPDGAFAEMIATLRA